MLEMFQIAKWELKTHTEVFQYGNVWAIMFQINIEN